MTRFQTLQHKAEIGQIWEGYGVVIDSICCDKTQFIAWIEFDNKKTYKFKIDIFHKITTY